MNKFGWLLLWGMLGMISPVLGQFTSPNRSPNRLGGGFQNPGGAGSGYNNQYDPLAGSFPGFEFDSTRNEVDSTKVPDIEPDTRTWDREAMFLHRTLIKHPVGVNIARFHIWDEVNQAGGFVRALGQIGKPYQLYLSGVNDRFLDLPLWENPIFGRYNRYVVDPEQQTLFFDTHTPYVNINFAQGDRRLLMVDVNTSINITPWINVSTYYERRRAEGAYAGMPTDHTLMNITGNYHTKNDRYFLFAAGVFNELTDGINGGILRDRGFQELYGVEDGIFLENDTLLNTSLAGNKNLLTNLRTNATRKLITRSAYLDHYYHLIREGDSVDRPHQLTLRNSLLVGYTAYRFSDGNSIDTSLLAQHLIPVYPTLNPDSLVLNEALFSRQFKALGGASYTYDGLFRFNLHGDINYQRISLIQDSTSGITRHDITEQNVYGEIDLGRIRAEASLRQRTSNLFAPARQLKLAGSLRPFPSTAPYRLRDTLSDPNDQPPVRRRRKKQDEPEELPTYTPLTLNVLYEFKDVQPSLFQGFFVPRSGNTFEARPGLQNQQLTRLQAEARYDMMAPITRGDTLIPNYFSAKAYVYRHNQMIFYDDQLRLLQAADGAALTRIGLELGFRLRFLRRFHWENHIHFQTTSLGANASEAFSYYADNLPALYGTSSLFFDIRNITIARKIRIGLDLHYNTGFNGMTVDPVSGEFFPANFRLDGYLRGDIYFAAQLLSAHVFIKYSHLNEGIINNGYFTTPFYPMLERTLSLGISWPFFD